MRLGRVGDQDELLPGIDVLRFLDVDSQSGRMLFERLKHSRRSSNDFRDFKIRGDLVNNYE